MSPVKADDLEYRAYMETLATENRYSLKDLLTHCLNSCGSSIQEAYMSLQRKSDSAFPLDRCQSVDVCILPLPDSISSTIQLMLLFRIHVTMHMHLCVTLPIAPHRGPVTGHIDVLTSLA